MNPNNYVVYAFFLPHVRSDKRIGPHSWNFCGSCGSLLLYCRWLIGAELRRLRIDNITICWQPEPSAGNCPPASALWPAWRQHQQHNRALGPSGNCGPGIGPSNQVTTADLATGRVYPPQNVTVGKQCPTNGAFSIPYTNSLLNNDSRCGPQADAACGGGGGVPWVQACTAYRTSHMLALDYLWITLHTAKHSCTVPSASEGNVNIRTQFTADHVHTLFAPCAEMPADCVACQHGGIAFHSRRVAASAP